ncbi:hypothetical protein COV18_04780 [Candidatus Woesearchaeota archaeon CG10_big_fil_rev_8_21_14_0_10_37_12]|nr:MAG: hypothetical protein COV18_04780 [Candidatus Woesearchaeota archaeon CG10_big_fil_rev_8_21_14_0_10_37_12]
MTKHQGKKHGSKADIGHTAAYIVEIRVVGELRRAYDIVTNSFAGSLTAAEQFYLGTPAYGKSDDGRAVLGLAAAVRDIANRCGLQYASASQGKCPLSDLVSDVGPELERREERLRAYFESTLAPKAYAAKKNVS